MKHVEHNKIEMRMIACVTDDGSIGQDGDLLVYDRKDLMHFKDLTKGAPVIMGRKTFESLPRMLPGRPHFVLTSDPTNLQMPSFIDDEDTTLITSADLEELVIHARRYVGDERKISFIGGESVYKEAIKYCDCCYLTHIPSHLTGDTKFPVTDMIFEMPHSTVVDTWDDDEGKQVTLLRYAREAA